MRRMNCHPGVVALGLAIALAIVCYIYRHIIEETLLVIAAIVVVGGFLALTGVVLRSYLAWRARTALALRSRSAAALEQGEAAAEYEEVWPAEAEADDPAAIRAAADILASELVGVAFSPDGQTIEVTRARKES